jgi:putative toxin-antitoxin system antitoxin component (TIGR02293 family)
MAAQKRSVRARTKRPAARVRKSAGRGGFKSYVHLREAVAEGGAPTAIEASRAGLPAAVLVSLAEHYAISRHRAYRLAGVAAATADRKLRRQERLTPEASERLTRIAWIESEAIEVLGSEAAAHRWLETPSMALGGERPIEMTDTGYGAEAVLRILGAIRYGGAA